MKNLILAFIVLAVLFAPVLNAQNTTARGNFLIGTALGFSTNTSKIAYSSPNIEDEGEGPSSTQLTIAPRIGYFLFDNFTLGVGLDYTMSKTEEPNADKNEDSDLLFGPFSRYYLPFGGDKAFFVEGNFGFGNSSDNIIIGGQTQNINTNIVAYGVGPGFTIFSNDGVGIETLFKYNYARSKFDTEVNGVATQTTATTNQFAVSLGIEFYFGGVRRVNR